MVNKRCRGVLLSFLFVCCMFHSFTGLINVYAASDDIIINVGGGTEQEGFFKEDSYTQEERGLRITINTKKEGSELELYRYGEQIAGYEISKDVLSGKMPASEYRPGLDKGLLGYADYIFKYEDAPVKDVEYEIIACEDIFDDGGETLFSKGSQVAVLTTDIRGKISLKNIFPGSYEIKEKKAGYGIMASSHSFKFMINRDGSVVYDGNMPAGDRPSLVIEIESTTPNNVRPEGTVYGLYSAENIYTDIVKDNGRWVRRVDGKLLIKNNTLIATAVTDSDGVALFDEDLPCGNYYVAEMSPASGFNPSNKTYKIDASYNAYGVETVKKLNIKTYETLTFIYPEDKNSGDSISGVSFAIYEILMDAKGNKVREGAGYKAVKKDEWISGGEKEQSYYAEDKDGNLRKIISSNDIKSGERLVVKKGHAVTGLQVGREYLLKVVGQKEGYRAEDNIWILLSDAGNGSVLYTARSGSSWKKESGDAVVVLAGRVKTETENDKEPSRNDSNTSDHDSGNPNYGNQDYGNQNNVAQDTGNNKDKTPQAGTGNNNNANKGNKYPSATDGDKPQGTGNVTVSPSVTKEATPTPSATKTPEVSPTPLIPSPSVTETDIDKEESVTETEEPTMTPMETLDSEVERDEESKENEDDSKKSDRKKGLAAGILIMASMSCVAAAAVLYFKKIR